MLLYLPDEKFVNKNDDLAKYAGCISGAGRSIGKCILYLGVVSFCVVITIIIEAEEEGWALQWWAGGCHSCNWGGTTHNRQMIEI